MSPRIVASTCALAALALAAVPVPPAGAHSLPPFDGERLLATEPPADNAPPSEVREYLLGLIRGLSPAERAFYRLLFRAFNRPDDEGGLWPELAGLDRPGALPFAIQAGAGDALSADLEMALDDLEAPKSLGADPQPGPLMAGVAAVDITPPRGCPLGGTGRWREDLLHHDDDLDPAWYSKFFWPPEDVHDPIMAKFVVLDNGQRRIVLGGLDTVGFSAHFFRTMTDQLEDLGIHRENFFVSATHNHSGPGAMNLLPFLWFGAMDIYDPRVAEPLIERLAGGVRAAVADLEPARIGYVTGPDDVGLSRNSRDDVEKVDPTIGVLRIDRADGTPKAVVFNFAAHVTALDSEWRHMSRDFSGFAEDWIEDGLGEGVVAFHVNGAEGDQVSDAHGRSNLDAAIWVGEQLGAQVLDLRATIATADEVELDVERKIKWMGAPHSRPGLWDTEYPMVPWWFVLPLGGTVETNARVAALRIDDLLIHSIPGEAIYDVGVKIRDHAHGKGYEDVWTFGLTNNYISYMTTREEYWQGGYQAAASLFGPNTGRKMINTSKGVINRISRRWDGPAR